MGRSADSKLEASRRIAGLCVLAVLLLATGCAPDVQYLSLNLALGQGCPSSCSEWGSTGCIRFLETTLLQPRDKDGHPVVGSAVPFGCNGDNDCKLGGRCLIRAGANLGVCVKQIDSASCRGVTQLKNPASDT